MAKKMRLNRTKFTKRVVLPIVAACTIFGASKCLLADQSNVEKQDGDSFINAIEKVVDLSNGCIGEDEDKGKIFIDERMRLFYLDVDGEEKRYYLDDAEKFEIDKENWKDIVGENKYFRVLKTKYAPELSMTEEVLYESIYNEDGSFLAALPMCVISDEEDVINKDIKPNDSEYEVVGDINELEQIMLCETKDSSIDFDLDK